jgi:cobalt-precorrin-5B (C1)-methyltransferase
MKNKDSPETQKYTTGDYGITTGTAATAAATAALLSIREPVEQVKIKAPAGELDIDIETSMKLTETSGRASVIKRPYKDPDVTKNLEIFADVQLSNKPGVTIHGGEGVGRVTKPGLQVGVGESAINPVPQSMLRSNLGEALKKTFPNKGVSVTINVPKGREIAKKTMNSRLGIVDGISILGTTGIARSMSSRSYKESLKCQIDIALAEGYKDLIFVPGNIGEKLAKKVLNVDDDQIVQMSNFVGYMLTEASNEGVKNITLFGHAGKLIKIAAGIFNTRHIVADGRREIMATHTALSGAKTSVVKHVFESNTTEDMIDLLYDENLVDPVFNSIAGSIKDLCQDKYDMNFDVVIVRMDGTVLNQNHDIMVNKEFVY